jgi:flagellar basal body rod protein FlgF
MKKKIFCFIFLVLPSLFFAQENNFFEEYKLLYSDLINIRTWGYKSFFNNELNSTDGNINISQGAIQMTEYNFDCAILGKGFFKIMIGENQIGYTRSGDFRCNVNGVITTSQGYTLFDTICLEEHFIQESFRVTRSHDVYITIIDDTGGAIEIKAGQIMTYEIPAELLNHYNGAIYTIKQDIEFNEKITFENRIITGALECSNAPLMPIALRMYYILSVLNESSIPNIEFKRKLYEILIEKTAYENLYLDRTLFRLNEMIEILNKNMETEEIFIEKLGTSIPIPVPGGTDIIQKYLDNRLRYLTDILPFIQYDY